MSSNIREMRQEVREAKHEVDEFKASLREANDLFTTYFALADKAGLDRKFVSMVRQLQQVRIAAQMAYNAIMMLYTGTGPVGWVLGFGSLAISGVMLIDQMEMGRARY